MIWAGGKLDEPNYIFGVSGKHSRRPRIVAISVSAHMHQIGSIPDESIRDAKGLNSGHVGGKSVKRSPRSNAEQGTAGL
jgi:hypothetical protein